MTKQKILVVDDDRKISGLVRFFLERRGGYEVLEQNHSYAAVSTAKRFRPDLIVLDVDMPGKDGGAVAAELREDSLFARTPIVFLTSLISPEEAGELHGKRYLAKSTEPQVLLETVRRLLHEVDGLPDPVPCLRA